MDGTALSRDRRRPAQLPPRSGRDVALAVLAVLLSFVLFSAGGSPERSPGAGQAAAQVLLALAMGVPLVERRRRPVAVTAVVVLAAAVHAVALTPVPPYALWFALYAVVTHAGSTRVAAVAGAATAAGTAVAVVAGPLAHGYGAGGVVPTLLLTVVVALAAALVRQQRERLEALRERASSLERERDAATREAAAQERLRIARDVHDLVGHGLSTVAVQSSTARLLLEDGQVDAARDRLAAVEHASRAAMREMRQLLGVLRDDAVRAPAPGLGDLEQLAETARAAGCAVGVRVGDVGAVPDGVALTAYRVVQEGLTNAVRHASGAEVAVDVTRDERALHVQVCDTGGSSTADDAGGSGLLGLTERVGALGGRVEAGPVGCGWRLHALLPLEEDR